MRLARGRPRVRRRARPRGRRAAAARLAAPRRAAAGRRAARRSATATSPIDEVQDFSPLEVRVLLDCLDERRSITLAGDTQQHVAAVRAASRRGATSSRSSASRAPRSSTLAGQLPLVARDRDVRARAARRPARGRRAPSRPRARARRSSSSASPTTAPASRSSPTRSRELAREEPLASVAVLTPSRELERPLLHAASSQSEVPRAAPRARTRTSRFAPGIEVTEIEQVKGLEFDYVVLVEASAEHYPGRPTRAPPAARRRDPRRPPALAHERRPPEPDRDAGDRRFESDRLKPSDVRRSSG